MLHKPQWLIRGALTLQLNWRPLWELLTNLYFREEPVLPPCGSKVEDAHRHTISKFCADARHFFPATAVSELMEYALPLMDNTDSVEVA